MAAFLSYMVLSIFTPGPNNVLAMVSGSQLGYRRSLPLLTGFVTGFMILMILSGFLNLALAQFVPSARVVLPWLGCGYMIYLAWAMIYHSDSQKTLPESVKGYVTGIALQLLNVKVLLFGVTVMSSFIVPAFPSAGAVLAWSVFLGSMSFSSVSLWALCGSLFQRFLSRWDRPFRFVMAALLLWCGWAIIRT